MAVSSESAPNEVTGVEISSRVWWISVAVILLVAAVLRFYDLPLVPLHHDEGVNGNFLVRLVREGYYRYDPENYHGPTLYYIAAIIPKTLKYLFGRSVSDAYGLNTVAIRAVPAFFGVATIWLIFLMRKRLGTIATLSAGFLLALSPGAIYLSRYFIHETLFVFFTLGIVVALVRFYDRRSPVDLLLASASAAMLFATKETAIMSAAVLLIAFVVTQVYERVMGSKAGRGPVKVSRSKNQRSAIQTFIDDIGGKAMLPVWIGLAIFIFIAINVLFYSSFFTNNNGVFDALNTFKFWSKTGKLAHVHPPLTYISWLFKQEAPLLILGAVGAAIVVVRPKNSLALFTALWAFGLIAAYSLVPYKTPWLVLNFIVPLAIISGYAVQKIYDAFPRQLWIPIAVMVIAVAVSGAKAGDLNFVNYDNDNAAYVYVYAHTTRGALKLVADIEKIAKAGEGPATGITIVSPDYWPLPWYLRDYTRVGYFGRMAPSTEPIILASEAQKGEMDANFGALYTQVPSGLDSGSYDLRPGVRLLLYLRKDRQMP